MCQICDGTGWVVGVDGAYRCKCLREKIEESKRGTPITPAAIAQAVQALGETLAFFPKGDAGRMLVGDAIGRMCTTVEQLRHMVRRAVSLYTKWETCGIPGLRQIVCSANTPADGVMPSITEAYPDGLPPESPRMPAMLSLPPGSSVSAAHSVELAVGDLARAKDMRNAGKRIEVHAIPEARGPQITRSDMEKAEREYREGKLNEAARKELSEGSTL